MNRLQPNIQSGEGATQAREYDILKKLDAVGFDPAGNSCHEIWSDISEAEALMPGKSACWRGLIFDPLFHGSIVNLHIFISKKLSQQIPPGGCIASHATVDQDFL
jgi:hypothetical protein